MSRPFAVHLAVFAGLLVALYIGAAGRMWSDDTQTQRVPTTVRDNPSSYRPSYIVWGGWSPPGSSGSGGGGGVGFGK